MYSYLVSNHLISENQSGFRPGDPTTSQLLSITTAIYESSENYEETHVIFLDISKAFDKVWHESLLFKLQCNGIDGNHYELLKTFFSSRKQRVILNGCESK